MASQILQRDWWDVQWNNYELVAEIWNPRGNHQFVIKELVLLSCVRSIERKPSSVGSGRPNFLAIANRKVITQYDDVYMTYRKQRSTSCHTSWVRELLFGNQNFSITASVWLQKWEQLRWSYILFNVKKTSDVCRVAILMHAVRILQMFQPGSVFHECWKFIVKFNSWKVFQISLAHRHNTQIFSFIFRYITHWALINFSFWVHAD